jgi:hypothetical protein
MPAKAKKRGAKKAPPPKHDRDYENMLLLNLKVLCKEREISVTGMNKADVVKALHKYDAKIDRKSKKGKEKKSATEASEASSEEEEEVRSTKSKKGTKSKKSKKVSSESEDAENDDDDEDEEDEEEEETKPRRSRKVSSESEEKPKHRKKTKKVSSSEEEPDSEPSSEADEQQDSDTKSTSGEKHAPKKDRVKESTKPSKSDSGPVVLQKPKLNFSPSTQGDDLPMIRKVIKNTVNEMTEKLDLFIKHTDGQKERFVDQLFFFKVANIVGGLEKEGDKSAKDLRKKYERIAEKDPLPSKVSEEDMAEAMTATFLEYYMGPLEKQKQCMSVFKGNEESFEKRVSKLYADLLRKLGLESVSQKTISLRGETAREDVSRLDISEPSPSPAKKHRVRDETPRDEKRRSVSLTPLRARKSAPMDLFGSESSSASSSSGNRRLETFKERSPLERRPSEERSPLKRGPDETKSSVEETKSSSGVTKSPLGRVKESRTPPRTPSRPVEEPRPEISRSESSDELVVPFTTAVSPRSPKNVVVTEERSSKKGESPRRSESSSVSIAWSSKYSTYVVEHDENIIAMNLAGGNRDAYAAIVGGKFVPIDDKVAKYLEVHLGISSSKNLRSKEIKRIRESQSLPEESESTSSSSSEPVDLIKRADQFLYESKSIIQAPTPQEEDLFARYKKLEDREVARKMNTTISRVRYLRQKL